MTATMGYARRVGTADSAPSVLEHAFSSCTIAKQAVHVLSDGIRGVRGRQSEEVVDGPYVAGGELVLEPRPDTLNKWLQYALGGTPAGTPSVIALAETLPTFVVDIDKGPKHCRYAGCKVNTATFRSSQGQPLALAMDIQALTEDSTITFPSISSSLSLLQPYMHHNLGTTGVTIGGVNYKPFAVEVMIDNALVQDRFQSTITRTELPEGDRAVQLSLDFPFTTDENALHEIAVAGISGSVQWTNGGYSLLFTFGRLQAPEIGPSIDARTGEVFRRLSFTSRRLTTTQELTATNDTTA
jgi:hypothetical protein